MPSFVDGLSTCIWFESGEKRNSLISIASGLLVSNSLSYFIILFSNITTAHFLVFQALNRTALS